MKKIREEGEEDGCEGRGQGASNPKNESSYFFFSDLKTIFSVDPRALSGERERIIDRPTCTSRRAGADNFRLYTRIKIAKRIKHMSLFLQVEEYICLPPPDTPGAPLLGRKPFSKLNAKISLRHLVV